MYVTIDPPPGVVRIGTEYKSKGRFYDTNLWRWYGGGSGPVGGWVQHSTGAVSGKARAIISWRDNAGNAWGAIGTHTGLYAMTRSGGLSDITPSGFVIGRADATTGGGYGSGVYGAGAYGTPRPSTYEVLDASVWSLDTWGEYLVGVMSDDGVIYQWELDVSVDAAPLANAPDATAIVVTAERIMMALGADGNPRRVKWSGQEDNTDWTPGAGDYAGQFDLQTPGKLMCGKRINGGTLLFTDVDVWLATFVGQPLVYGFENRGENCGVISRQCVAPTGSLVFWMGKNGFYVFDGYTRPLPCDVQDKVFADINYIQSSKVTAFHNSAFGEVWWFYCSSNSVEIDRYVVYNYRENHWTIGSLVRLCGTDRGVFLNPMLVGDDGIVYDHETGTLRDGVQPYARTGPFEIGQGDQTVMVRKVIPDERNLGSVTVSFATRFFPMGAEVVYGPYSLTENTDTRFTARQVEMTYTGVADTDFQVGNFRCDVVARGRR